MQRIHLDTDIGSDTDDLCALAMLLGWPEVEVVAVTTVSDPNGIRAAMARYALGLAGREDIPVAAGAEGSVGGYFVPLEFPEYWPEPIEPMGRRPGEALDLFETSVDAGATVVAIGPYTNLATYEAARPGRLADAGVVVMGGWVTPPREGYPAWTWDQDFNVQQDAYAAKVVFDRCEPVVTQVSATLETALRARDLPKLDAGGPLARLLAHQARRRAEDHSMARLADHNPSLPPDLLNFQYDPLACAVACGWDGVKLDDFRLRPELVGPRLRLFEDDGGLPMHVVTGVDAERFASEWLDAVLRASRPEGRG